MVSRRPRQLDWRGISLAELMIVMSIIGVMAVLAFPLLMTYWRASTLEAGARELQSVLNDARQLAIKENTNVCVTNDGTRVQLHVGTGNPCGGTAWTGPGTDASGWIRLANSVQVTGSTANVTFTYLGAASPAGTFTVRNPADGQTVCVVVATSGRLTIQGC